VPAFEGREGGRLGTTVGGDHKKANTIPGRKRTLSRESKNGMVSTLQVEFSSNELFDK
jgi:hypothetical protein